MIYTEKQRDVTTIQIRRLEAELRLLTKLNPRGWIEKAQIEGLMSAIDDLKLELTQFNRRYSD